MNSSVSGFVKLNWSVAHFSRHSMAWPNTPPHCVQYRYRAKLYGRAFRPIQAAQAAQKRTMEALQRAKKAEAANLRQVKRLPGIRRRLVRWLAGDVLE